MPVVCASRKPPATEPKRLRRSTSKRGRTDSAPLQNVRRAVCQNGVRQEAWVVTERRVALLILAGVAIRLAIIASSIGTNDVAFMILWARLAEQYGIAHAYARMVELNHPPLSLLIITLLAKAGRSLHVEMTDLLRGLQVAADLLTVWSLRHVSKEAGRAPLAWAAFFFCPAAIAISAFHCNTDSMMISLVVLGALCAMRGYSVAAGIALGFGMGTKFVALFALPFVVMALPRWRQRILSVATFGATSAAVFLPAVVIGGAVVVKNIFGYSGFPGKWGVPAIALSLEGLITTPRTSGLFRFALTYAEYGKYLVVLAVSLLIILFVRLPAIRRRILLPGFIALAFMLMLVFAPGYGVQYLLWPLPLLPFIEANRRLLAAVWVSIAAFVFTTYTIWSQSFPWWYADSIAPSPGKPLLIPLGIVVWCLLVATSISAIARIVVRDNEVA